MLCHVLSVEIKEIARNADRPQALLCKLHACTNNVAQEIDFRENFALANVSLLPSLLANLVTQLTG